MFSNVSEWLEKTNSKLIRWFAGLRFRLPPKYHPVCDRIVFILFGKRSYTYNYRTKTFGKPVSTFMPPLYLEAVQDKIFKKETEVAFEKAALSIKQKPAAKPQPSV